MVCSPVSLFPEPTQPVQDCPLILFTGQFLAVGWDDGTVRLLGVENTKVVHRINVAQHDSGNDAEPAPITHIGWARNLARKRYHGPKSHVRAELSDPLDAEDGHLANLPHALTFLEIDASLPKISPLPVSGGTGDDMFVFSTTAALESMFPPWKLEDHSVVDVMVVGTKDGHVHLSIYDSFSIGSFGVPIEAPGLKNPGSPVSAFGGQQLVLHASHPEVSTHCLLMGPSEDHGRTTQLFVVPMDLRFVSHSPFDLSLLASKTTTLQKLLRYVKQAQIHMVNEWQGTRDLPARFLNFVQQDLQKMRSGPASIVQALYHTVLTGHVYQPVREWLVDSIGDRVGIRLRHLSCSSIWLTYSNRAINAGRKPSFPVLSLSATSSTRTCYQPSSAAPSSSAGYLEWLDFTSKMTTSASPMPTSTDLSTSWPP